MNAISREMRKKREEQEKLRQASLYIACSVLTARDLYKLDHDQLMTHCRALQEMILGYGEEGADALIEELKEEGIDIIVRGA